MKKTAKARLIIFIIIHIVLCLCAFLYTKEFADISISAYNGVFYTINFIVGIAVMFFISMILIIPFRLISVRKLTEVSDFELKTTLKIIIAGIVIMLLAGIIFLGINMLIPMLIMTVPPLIFEIFLYWFSLKEKNLNGKKED
ncbi:MAG: hypothetical protein ACI4JM_12965 [Oscillospiraceae bacterium]